MNETDREFRKIFEETTTRNVRASIKFSNDTRVLIHTLEERVLKLEAQIIELNTQLEMFRTQLAPLQAIVFRGGTS
jgi:chaperonin cofactor prefoldin